MVLGSFQKFQLKRAGSDPLPAALMKLYISKNLGFKNTVIILTSTGISKLVSLTEGIDL